MYGFLKTIVAKIVDLFPLRNIILFESCPDLSDNTKPVFDEMIKEGLNKKYKFVWLCFDEEKVLHNKEKNISYVYAKKHKIKYFLLNHLAKMAICCNRFIGSDRKKQLIVYLMHGGPLKDTRLYYTVPKKVDWMITPGDKITNICANVCNFPVEKCVPLGYPRNDTLTKKKIDLRALFGKFDKYVVWYPTVKQFKTGRKAGSVKPIPLIHNKQNFMALNSFASKNNVLIVIKPHFSQVNDNIYNESLSNIKFINEDFFRMNNITSYEFVGSCDALITDYSSIYYDFTLCDKPICLIWEDIEDYLKNPGLVDEYEKLTSGGEKIYTFDELLLFLKRVKEDVDLLKIKRNEICDYSNASRDGESTSRVVEFIKKILH